METEQIARVCHEANRALQMIFGDPNPSPSWDEAPQWQRDAACDGVMQTLTGATAEELHESWLDFKRQDGWTLGPVKDPEIKTHPAMVPYSELPFEQKVKDHLFTGIVNALTKDDV